MKNEYSLPQTPAISRFCPPWDTDGWYYVCRGFDKKSQVHSNSDVGVLKYGIEKLRGADYIVTYDSILDGKDDHQECDFYAESDGTLFIAFDGAAVSRNDVPQWLRNDFRPCGANIIMNDKTTSYALFSREISAGEHITVPDFSGDYHHYFLIVVPREETAPGALVSAPANTQNDKKYISREYRDEYGCIISECFNYGIPDGFVCGGDVSVISAYEDDEKYKSVRLRGDAYLKYSASSDAYGGKLIAKTTVTLLNEAGEYLFGSIIIKGGKIFCGSNPVCDAEYCVPVAIEASYDFAKCSISVTVNHTIRGISTGIPNADVSSFVCRGGEMLIDYVSVIEDAETFVCDEDFASMPALCASENADIGLCDFPFAENKSVKLTGGAMGYDFPAVSGKLSIETRIFVSNPECCAVFAKDALGNTAAGAAFYKNSLFALVGNKWVNVLDDFTPYCYYPAENWYEVRFVLDTAKKTYDLWTDGAERLKNIKFNEKAEEISRAEFSCAANAELFVNHIRIYDDVSLARGVLRGKVFDVKKFGAKGNGKADDTAAINRAIAAAAYTGGTVYVHGGNFSTGELTLASDMTFFVAPDAVITGSQDHAKYPLRVPGRSLCAHRQLGRGLLYGERIRNVTVTGGGTIDGNGKYRFKMNDPYADKRELDARPDIIYIAYSNEINIENLNLRRSAFWTVVPLSSRNITIKNLRLNCMNTPNRDGIDPVDCKNISVYHCNIMAGDDGLCFKSSDVFGCENIDAHDLMISSLASAVKFGTDTYYTLEHAVFRDCFIKNVNRCGVSLETVDGAYVGDVLFERFDITDASAPAYVVTGARNRLPKGIDDVRQSKINGVTFRSLNFRCPRTHGHPLPIYETLVVGQNPEQSVENILFEDWNIAVMGGCENSTAPAPAPIDDKYPEYDRHGLSAGYAFALRYCKNPKMKNINITKMFFPDNRPMVAFFDCKK